MSELLAQYEEGIAEKEKELDMLRSQREELKQVEEMLQNLHVSYLMSCDMCLLITSY